MKNILIVILSALLTTVTYANQNSVILGQFSGHESEIEAPAKSNDSNCTISEIITIRGNELKGKIEQIEPDKYCLIKLLNGKILSVGLKDIKKIIEYTEDKNIYRENALYHLSSGKDEYGLNNLDDVNEVAFVESKPGFGNCADFDSNKLQHLIKSNPAGFPTGNSQFTFECWVNFKDIKPPARLYHDGYTIFSYGGKGRALNNIYVRLYKQLYKPENNPILVWGDDWGEYNSVKNPFIPNNWYHIALTYNGSVLRCFLNGIKQGNDRAIKLNLQPEALRIGCYELTKGETGIGGSKYGMNMNGKIDELRVSNYCRYDKNFSPLKFPFEKEPNLIIKAEWNYKDGKLNDISRKYYKNGQIMKEIYFKNGMKDGIYKINDNTGKPMLTCKYKSNKLEGIARIYYSDGEIKYIDTYKNGEKINRKAYDKEGKLRFDQDYPYER